MERNEIKERGKEISDGVDTFEGPTIDGVLIDSNGDGVFDKVLMDTNNDGLLDTTAFCIDSATTIVDTNDGV